MSHSKDILLMLVSSILSSIFIIIGFSVYQWYYRSIGIIIIIVLVWLSDTGIMSIAYKHITEFIIRSFNKD